MKNHFTRFATGFLTAVLLGLVFLCLYGKLPCTLTAILAPRNGSPWELSKLAYFPLMGALLVLHFTVKESSPGAFAALTATPLALFLLLFAAGKFLGRGSLALWVMLLAGGLYLSGRIRKNAPVWVVLATALGIAYILFTLFPPPLLPFLDPADVASFAAIPF